MKTLIVFCISVAEWRAAPRLQYRNAPRLLLRAGEQWWGPDIIPSLPHLLRPVK